MIIIRQKNYSLASRILGKKRLKKLLDKSINNKRAKQKNLKELIETSPENKELGDYLKNKAKENDLVVFENNQVPTVLNDSPGDFRGTYGIPTREKYRKELVDNWDTMDKNKKDVLKVIVKKGKLINLSGTASKPPQVLAHELGHELNTKNKITKFIQDVYHHNINFKPKKYEKDPKRGLIGNTVGSIVHDLKNRWKILKGDLTVPIEESNAWRNGIKSLKEGGATKDELEIARKMKDAAVGSYKEGRKANRYKRMLETELNREKSKKNR